MASSSSFFDSAPSSSFALIADTQYVNLDDGGNFDGSRVRRFRQSLQILRKACTEYNRIADRPNFGVILGDIIDMKAANNNMVEECLQAVVDETTKVSIPWHFLFGNHDAYCLGRDRVFNTYIPDIPQKQACSPSRLYYDFTNPNIPNIRFIILDAFDCSWIGASSEELRLLAIESIKKNPNLKYNEAEGTWPNSDWLVGLEEKMELKRYVPCGGGIGPQQLEWLRATLHAARQIGERCIVFSHLPCFPDCTYFTECCMFNSDEVLETLHEVPGTVVAFIAGHDHTGGYAVDSEGIHHLIPPAPIDCQLDDVAYGLVTVNEDHLKLRWKGSPPPKYALAKPWPKRMKFPLLRDV
jgi:manganese-dependent ADP-ribose/CDP-alcohol diphosphatase